MQEQPQTVQPHASSGTNEAGHPTALRYIQIALILAALTGIEVWVYYQKELARFLITVLLTLSAIKFSMVVLWYMHLKFDNKLFSALFTLGLTIGASILITMIFLFRSFLFK